ncbi:MAG: hypothetical protein JRI23_04650 [Deltaproteobacteria bacterium]|jgi:hypothetical protein|nr:hypothetical protein [Deltaproteobacteria bacterium]MBW2530838.1 hypothetical protein [Deltaproteobacteria bacterium]
MRHSGTGRPHALLEAIEARIADLDASGEAPELQASLQEGLDDNRTVNGL